MILTKILFYYCLLYTSFEIPLLTLYNYLPKEIISTGMTEAIVLKNSNDLNEAYKLFSLSLIHI